MSKTVITRLFAGAFVAVAAGIVLALASVLYAIAGGVFTIGGSQIVTVHGTDLAGALIWLVVAVFLIAAGTLAALASWIGALLNTAQLEDKAWFVVLLVLGVFSLGWVAMLAYVLAGPDATRRDEPSSGVATTAGA